MAIVLDGSSNMFDALVFGQGNRTGQEFIDNLNNNFLQNATAPVLESFNYLMQTSMFQSYRQDALAQLQAMDNAHLLIMQPNSIHQLYELAQFQHASTTMQRWIMANPIIGQMYNNLEIDGYSDNSTLPRNKDVGIDNYDYRCATNGISMQHGDGDDDEDFCRWNWNQILHSENDDLTFLEQVSIMNSWNNALFYIAQRFDPTSKYGDMLP